MSKIAEICERDVVKGPPGMTVEAAAKLMRHEHVGCIVVVDRDTGGLSTPVGIVTDRDIVVEVTAAGLDPNTLTLGDIMARDLVTVHAGTDIPVAMRLMQSRGVRRLPVVSDAGHLLGLVAFDDLLEWSTEVLFNLTRTALREQTREVMARK